MNRILSNELNLFARELRACLSPTVLKDIAKRVGFVKRKSKYQANELIALCVWLSQEVGSTSLPQLCSRLEASTGVSMSAEGLNQRFSQAAVAYPSRGLSHAACTKALCESIAPRHVDVSV